MDTSNLKRNVISTARVVKGSTLWMDHFSAVSVIAEQPNGNLTVVDISASQWEKATANLPLEERLELLTTITGKPAVGYTMPVVGTHYEDLVRRFGGVSHGVTH